MCGTFVKGSARDGASRAVGTCPTWLRQRSRRRTQDSRRPLRGADRRSTCWPRSGTCRAWTTPRTAPTACTVTRVRLLVLAADAALLAPGSLTTVRRCALTMRDW